MNFSIARLWSRAPDELLESLIPQPSEASATDIESPHPRWMDALPCQPVRVPVLECALAPSSPSTPTLCPTPVAETPPVSHRGPLLGGAIGAFIGAVFGMQYADAFVAAPIRLSGSFGGGDPVWWPYCIYIPIFAASTAVTGTTIAQVIDGALLQSKTAFLSYGFQVAAKDSERGRALSRQLSRREAAAVVIGMVWGVWLGCDYAWMLGGGWPYRVFPVALALNQPLGVLALLRWWVVPPVRAACRMAMPSALEV